MNRAIHNKLVGFIWSIADDELRDVYVRGKYRDVILPMFVLRRLDCLLEITKAAVQEEVRFQQKEVGLTDLDPEGLSEASGYVFYNISKFTLNRLVKTATNNQQALEANFQVYLDGFSENVKEIIKKFKLRDKVKHMADKDVLLNILEKFTSPYINLTHLEAQDPEGRKLSALTNLGMGYVFEELIRKFNEENNEEAGEHFTPRDVIDLMTHIIFKPVKDKLPPVITVYDGACGSGGMLTESQKFITDGNGKIRTKSAVYLYGKEVNDETYAICKSDMMIKGNDPENIKNGSTLASDDFSEMHFDFMLSNPPYGKSWTTDQKYIMDGKTILDPRFEVELADYWGKIEIAKATPRSSDGQLLFLMDMARKMKSLDESPLGSRVASVHNGSSLFTGDAGSGESNIRRYLLENDLVEAIIQLPTNLFYNTGITTYIWILANNKADQRKGKIQLIDASQNFRKLRKNLGDRNCELSPKHIKDIADLYLGMVHDGIAKVFNNSDFGYYKVTVERPQHLAAQFTPERIAPLRFANHIEEPMTWAYKRWGNAIYEELATHKKEIQLWLDDEEINLTSKNRNRLFNLKTWEKQKALFETAQTLMESIGQQLFMDFNEFVGLVNTTLKELDLKLSTSEKKKILGAVSWREEKAEKVIKKVHQLTDKKLARLMAELDCSKTDLRDYGYWPTSNTSEYIEYEPDSDLKDTENVPLDEKIHAYFLREVRPHVDEAWMDISKTKIGYAISFNKYFYQHKPLRTLEEVTQEIIALERETDGLLKTLLGKGQME
jgi:type I restriction enzyme M protein